MPTQLVTSSINFSGGVVKLPAAPGLGVAIDWDFVGAHPYHGEHGIGAGARPAFGLAMETLPDRAVEALH